MANDDFAAAEARFRSYLDRNKAWAETHQPSADWAHYPAHAACAVVSCMDARVIPEYLLDVGEMNIAVIRNAGGRVQDAMRSLYTLVGVGGGGKGGLGCVAIIHHTDCGMMEFTDEHNREMLRRYADAEAVPELQPIDFGSFTDLETSIKEDMQTLKADRVLPKGLRVLGFVYDIKTGLLTEIDGN